MYTLKLPVALSHYGILAAHGVVELVATHEIDLDEAEEILKLCYGSDSMIGTELQQMLVGMSSKKKIHQAIELAYLTQVSSIASGWSTYMAPKSEELVQEFLDECKIQEHSV